jgi:hypothetical protein
VQTQKVPFGVDPKTVLCAFFKVGTCEKGGKCKFSHDMNVGRKVEKKNLYEDSREEKLNGAFLALFLVDFCCWADVECWLDLVQIQWILGTPKSCSKLSCPKLGTQELRQRCHSLTRKPCSVLILATLS